MGLLPLSPFLNAQLFPAGLAPKCRFHPLNISIGCMVADLSAGSPLVVYVLIHGIYGTCTVPMVHIAFYMLCTHS